MSLIDTDRRNFLKKAGGSVVAAAAGSSIAFSAIRAFAAEKNPSGTQEVDGDAMRKQTRSRMSDTRQKKEAQPMIAVLFEVWPKDERKQEYLDIAARLRPLLEGIDGFISIERFESLNEPGKILSLSFWRDEKAIAKWRQLEAHRSAQKIGRGGAFKDYRIRVAGVVRDYGMSDREGTPGDSREFHG
jgi:heme-degrading monooxygenase HmoA